MRVLAAWHTDSRDVETREPARLLSTVILLDEPGQDFTGGLFEVALCDGTQIDYSSVLSLPLRKGDAVVFAANQMWHRVTAIKSGVRHSLVMWLRGPSKPPPQMLPSIERREKAKLCRVWPTSLSNDEPVAF